MRLASIKHIWVFLLSSHKDIVAKGALLWIMKVKNKSKNIAKSAKNAKIPTTYLGILSKYEDEMLSPTFRYHVKWGSGHIIGMKTSSMYFRSNSKAIKCDFCRKCFYANKERIRHVKMKHPEKVNVKESSDQFNFGLRKINVNLLNDETRESPWMILLPFEHPVPRSKRVTKKKLKISPSPTEADEPACSVSSSSSRPSVLVRIFSSSPSDSWSGGAMCGSGVWSQLGCTAAPAFFVFSSSKFRGTRPITWALS